MGKNMVHHLMEDDESLAEAVELGKLRAINALLARRVCDVFAMRVSDMGIAQRELADASVLIDREKRKSGSLSYVVVAVFRSVERRVGKGCVSTFRSRGLPVS